MTASGEGKFLDNPSFSMCHISFHLNYYNFSPWLSILIRGGYNDAITLRLFFCSIVTILNHSSLHFVK